MPNLGLHISICNQDGIASSDMLGRWRRENVEGSRDALGHPSVKEVDRKLVEQLTK